MSNGSQYSVKPRDRFAPISTCDSIRSAIKPLRLHRGQGIKKQIPESYEYPQRSHMDSREVGKSVKVKNSDSVFKPRMKIETTCELLAGTCRS
jgi:hypothetical protein